MENVERFTSYTVHGHEQYMDNLRSDKEGYFHVLVFYALFYKEIKNTFSRVPMYTLQKNAWKFGSTRNDKKTLALRPWACVHTWISRPPKRPLVFL